MVDDEFKCQVHGLMRETTCSWCGGPICEHCILANDGKNYCIKCYSKLSKNSFARKLNRDRWKGESVKNADPDLGEEDMKKIKKMFEMQEKAKKILGEKY